MAIVYEWVPYYYRHPEPEQISAVFYRIASQGKIVDDASNFSFLGNLSITAEKNLNRVKPYLPDSFEKILVPEQQIILQSQDIGTFVHYFSTLLHEHPDKITDFRTQSGQLSNKWQDVYEAIIRKAETYTPASLRSISDFDLLAAEFMVTGNTDILKKMLMPLDQQKSTETCDFIDELEDKLYSVALFNENASVFFQLEGEEAKGLKKEILKRIIFKIVEHNGKIARGHQQKGVNYVHEENYSAAREEYYKALSFYPDYSSAYVNLPIPTNFKGKWTKLTLPA